MARTTVKAKKATPPATTPDKRTLEPHELVLSPTIQSAVGIKAWGKFGGEANLGDLLDGLQTRVEKVLDGDIRSVESMLYGQAMTLQTIFTNLAQRAALNAGEYLNATDTYLRLALKAQAQCRATLETLAEIKNPRSVAFVKQANISGGHQQINNGIEQDSAHAKKTEIAKNELLEASNGNGLDYGAQSQAGRADQDMEAMAESHRAAHA